MILDLELLSLVLCCGFFVFCGIVKGIWFRIFKIILISFFFKGNIFLLLYVLFYNFLYFSLENFWVLNFIILFKSLKMLEKNEMDVVKDLN